MQKVASHNNLLLKSGDSGWYQAITPNPMPALAAPHTNLMLFLGEMLSESEDEDSGSPFGALSGTSGSNFNLFVLRKASPVTVFSSCEQV